MTLTDRPDTATVPVTTPLLAPPYRWATIGMVSLVFLAAFEALAVTTIMPSVSADLDGRAWFSAAFSATLAASVVGMVAGGLWSDRSGPRLPLLVSVAVFAGGLLLAGLAPGIELFVAARFLQGLGAGAMTVALYVVVARIYAPIDHPRIFGAFAAAWVIPSMVGPSVAGVVAEAVGLALGLPRRRRAGGRGDRDAAAGAARARRQPRAVVGGDPRPARAGRRRRRSPWSHSTWPAGPRPGVGLRWPPSSRWWSWWSPSGPLLPAGTLVVRRGLPAVIALRGAIAATFFATEIYLPYLLQEHYDVSAVAVRRDPDRRRARLGRRLAGAGPARCPARPPRRAPDRGRAPARRHRRRSWSATALQLTPGLIGAAWVLAGAGMGLMFPRISAVVLAASTERDQGGNSAAMSISDAVGGATAISLTGLVFTAVGTGLRAGRRSSRSDAHHRAGRSGRCWSRGVRN